jgi:hypothetical protein
VDLAAKFLVNCSLYRFDCFTFFVKLGCPQGLLLTEQSAFTVIIGKTTQQAFMINGRFVAFTIAEDLVHYLWIFLCRSICLMGHTSKQRRIEYRACFTSLDGEGLAPFTPYVDKGYVPR